MAFEIRLTNVPDGAYTEDYLGAHRYQASYRDADDIVQKFEGAREERPEDFEPDMTAEIVEVPDDVLSERYHVRVIAEDRFGRILATSDDQAIANAIAEDRAYDYYYGTAIIDTETGMADVGDEVLPASEYFRHVEIDTD